MERGAEAPVSLYEDGGRKVPAGALAQALLSLSGDRRGLLCLRAKERRQR
jgi:hypothetical protein